MVYNLNLSSSKKRKFGGIGVCPPTKSQPWTALPKNKKPFNTGKLRLDSK